jgi:hypothetical protein
VFALELAVPELRRLLPPTFPVELDSDDACLAWSPPTRGAVEADVGNAALSEVATVDELLRFLRHTVMKEVGGDTELGKTCSPLGGGPDARFAIDILRSRGSNIGEDAACR